MKAVVKTYDRRCYDLAALFLGDERDLHTEANIHALALEIQQCIEDEILFMSIRSTDPDENPPT
jgi:hypothetical protein